MDDSSLANIAILIGLITLHAVIALGYAAATNVRPGALREQSDDGSHFAKRVLALLDANTSLLLTYRLSTLIIQLIAAGWMIASFGDVLRTRLPDSAPLLLYSALLLPMGIVLFVFSELVPASIGARYALAVLKWLLPFMRLLIVIFKPAVAVLIMLGKVFSAPFGSETQVNTVTEEEIMTFVEGGTLEEEEKEMIYSVLQLDEKLVRDVMVPRIDVVGLEINSSVAQALERFIKSGFSRIPVYEEIIDNIKGVLYAKDLLTSWHNGSREQAAVQSMLRPAYFVPESRPADLLLQEMKLRKVHIAIVVDEYGGTAGLITIEDLIEQIIGDIQDEYDLNEEDEYKQIGEGEFVVDAGINIDLFNDVLEVELPSEDSNTLGGFIYAQIGRIPEVGDTITTDEITLRVESLERRRIRKVYVRRHTAQDSPPSEVQDTHSVPLPTVIKDADKPLAFSR